MECRQSVSHIPPPPPRRRNTINRTDFMQSSFDRLEAVESTSTYSECLFTTSFVGYRRKSTVPRAYVSPVAVSAISVCVVASYACGADARCRGFAGRLHSEVNCCFDVVAWDKMYVRHSIPLFIFFRQLFAVFDSGV